MSTIQAGVYSVKTDRNKHICTVVGTIKEETLIKHIKKTTRKNGTIISKKVEIIEEKKKVEFKEENKGGIEVKKKEIEVKEKIEIEEIKHKEVVAPYFIPCSHPRFVDYSHPDFHHYGGCGYAPHYFGYHGRPEYNYRDIPEFKNLNYPPFLHCTHSPEFINEENPYACSVM
jgi:hypothetical protein